MSKWLWLLCLIVVLLSFFTSSYLYYWRCRCDDEICICSIPDDNFSVGLYQPYTTSQSILEYRSSTERVGLVNCSECSGVVYLNSKLDVWKISGELKEKLELEKSWFKYNFRLDIHSSGIYLFEKLFVPAFIDGKVKPFNEVVAYGETYNGKYSSISDEYGYFNVAVKPNEEVMLTIEGNNISRLIKAPGPNETITASVTSYCSKDLKEVAIAFGCLVSSIGDVIYSHFNTMVYDLQTISRNSISDWSNMPTQALWNGTLGVLETFGAISFKCRNESNCNVTVLFNATDGPKSVELWKMNDKNTLWEYIGVTGKIKIGSNYYYQATFYSSGYYNCDKYFNPSFIEGKSSSIGSTVTAYGIDFSGAYKSVVGEDGRFRLQVRPEGMVALSIDGFTVSGDIKTPKEGKSREVVVSNFPTKVKIEIEKSCDYSLKCGGNLCMCMPDGTNVLKMINPKSREDLNQMHPLVARVNNQEGYLHSFGAVEVVCTQKNCVAYFDASEGPDVVGLWIWISAQKYWSKIGDVQRTFINGHPIYMFSINNSNGFYNLDIFFSSSYITGQLKLGSGALISAYGVGYNFKWETSADANGIFTIPVKPDELVEIIMNNEKVHEPVKALGVGQKLTIVTKASALSIGRVNDYQGIKVIIGDFDGHATNTKPFTTDLADLGFDFVIVTNENKLLEMLNHQRYNVIIIISACISTPSNSPYLNPMIDAIVSAFKNGAGLLLMGDNIPCNYHVNLILNKLPGLSNMILEGNDPGLKMLKPGNPLETGYFGSHPITERVGELFEGHSISYPNYVPSNMQVIATSTHGKPSILASDETYNKLIIDTGFTKLYPSYWAITPGTSMYITNSICWLSQKR